MKALSLYLTSLNRYRRSRGFGVHSPFAYYFIKRVIKEHCGYYSYPVINRAADRADMSRSEARLLFRVANYFNQPVMMVAAENAAAMTALQSVASAATVCHVGSVDDGMRCMSAIGDNRPFLYVDPSSLLGDDELKSLVTDIIARQGIVVIGRMKRCNRSRRLFNDVEAAMKRGMTFSNGTTAVVISDDKLPRQRFSLWF